MFNNTLLLLPDILCEAKKSKFIQYDNKNIYNVIYNYIKQHKLIISDINMLSENKNTPISLYSNNIFNHANNLANELSKINIYTKLYTVVKNEEFNITIESKTFVYFYNINNNEFKFVKFIKIDNFVYMSPYYEMIDIYSTLYNPSKYNVWEKYTEIENKFKKHILTTKLTYKEYKKNIDHNILNILLKRKDYILIGVCAINLLKDIKINSAIQLISSHKTAQELAKQLSCHIIEYNNILKNENRLNKYVLYKNNNGKKEHIMVIYNNLDYELVPYTVYKNFNIAYLDVIAFHLFVDIYNSRVYKNDNLINNVIQESLSNYTKLDTIDPGIFYREQYLGVNNPREIYKTKLSINNKFFPYLPEQHRYLKGDYRKL